ncbi:radical SAM protein [bacterium]|nr:MAG: radical SAM protein [bacterium]
MQKTLLRREHELADPKRQIEHLQQLELPRFDAKLSACGLSPLRATALDTLQVNVGRRCNQMCAHCHVDAGPDRKELMSDNVLEACLALLATGGFRALDITGGAPELHPRFAELVERAATSGVHVMHRCNLTAIRLPAYRHLPQLFADNRVEVVASLPALQAVKTDRQRGEGVFDDSIISLRELNELGYARPDTGLLLNLVSNPVGAFLPADQASMERDFRSRLREDFDIEFDHLFTITNLPVSRFLEWLEDSGNLVDYMTRLVNAFNPAAAGAVMCRSMVSVGPDGRIFDCDFNQMLEIEASAPSILEQEPGVLVQALQGREIRTAEHCYGCTAGAGSSCGGAVA